MKTHSLTQGSKEWHAYRANHFNASDAPAMMGCSPYKSRDQLLREIHTGLTQEVDAGTQRLFDNGHKFEALARPLAEKIIGQDLYPVVGSKEKYSASFDGLTMDESIAFEHKTLNTDLQMVMGNGCIGTDLPLQYQIQMEQQLFVSGAGHVLFMASKWDGDDLRDERHCWYEPNADLRAKILQGWAQFAIDLAAYVPPALVTEVVGHTPETLPALFIEVSGEVTASNLAQYKEHAMTVFKAINRELTTDQHFADAEKAVKWCGDVESRLEAAKEHALSQTASIDQLFRAIDDISMEARRTRLELDKLVKARKEELRTSIVTEANTALRQHVAALNIRIGKPYMPAVPADFAGSIKGKKSLDSMRSAVSTVLANSKIEASAIADRIQINLETKGLQGYATLFPDVATLCLKGVDDFQNTVTARITTHEASEAARAKSIKDAADLEASEIARLAAVNTTMVQEAKPVAVTETVTVLGALVPTLSVVRISTMRQSLNDHLDTLADEDLERVLRFCQSRYPLQAKAA